MLPLAAAERDFSQHDEPVRILPADTRDEFIVVRIQFIIGGNQARSSDAVAIHEPEHQIALVEPAGTPGPDDKILPAPLPDVHVGIERRCERLAGHCGWGQGSHQTVFKAAGRPGGCVAHCTARSASATASTPSSGVITGDTLVFPMQATQCSSSMRKAKE